MIDGLFIYLTEFMINAANMLGISYYEMNTLVLLVAMPLVLLFQAIKLAYNFVVLIWLDMKSTRSR